MERREHFEIERSSGFSARAIQVANSRGRSARSWISSTTAARHLPPTWVGGRDAAPSGGSAGRSFAIIFFDDFGQFLETKSWSLKTEFMGVGNFWSRVIGNCMSRREIKIDVWKYIRPILMGLGAVLEKKLDNLDRALRQGQMSPSNPNPLERGSNRGISLSGHCTGKSAVTPTLPSKCGMRATTARNVSECADVKWSAKIENGVRKGRDRTSSLPVFRTSSQHEPCKYCEKVSGESHVTQEHWRSSLIFLLVFQ